MGQNGEAQWSGLRHQPFVPLLSRAHGQQESNKLGYTETLRCKAKLRELPAPLRGHNRPPYFHVVLKAGNVLFLFSFKA